MDARDDDGDVRGWAGGMRELLETEGAGRGVDGAGSVVAPPGGRAMGCSGRTGRPPSPGP